MRTSLAALFFLVAVFAAPLAAQEPRVFRADKDLEGYEQCGFSEFRDVYVFTEFKAADGKTLSAAEIETLRAHWKTEKERAAKRIAEIEADPLERWSWKLGKRLAQHNWFSKIAFTLEKPEPGFLVVVQRPAKDDPGYAARVVSFYQPFVKKLAANFEAQIAAPAGLQRHAEREGIAYAVLASKTDFDSFSDAIQDTTDYAGNSAYDAQLGLAFTYEDAALRGNAPAAQRASLLFQVAKELQHAHMAIDGTRPGSLWLYQGLAFLLSTHEGAAPEALDKHWLRPGSAGLVSELLGHEERREQLLLPLEELAGLRTFDQYREAVSRRSLRLHTDDPTPDEEQLAWLAQCELWSNYLFDGAQGLNRKRYLVFLTTALAGEAGTRELRTAFAGSDPHSISRDFLRAVCAEAERTHTGKKVDRALIDQLYPSGPAAAENTAGAAKPAAGAAPEATASAFAPERLLPDANDLDAQLALRMLQAREGDLAGAVQSLGELAAHAPAPWPARLARESARMGELAKLRDGYLAYLKATNGKLVFKHKGKDVQAPVAGIEKGEVRLGENKSGLTTLALASVDPYEIAKLAAKKEMQGEAQSWARYYAYALAGDARWEKLLKEDSPAIRELREDAKTYPALAKTGLVAKSLVELGKRGLPHDAKEATECLERVRAFLAANAGTDLLARRIDALRELAAAALVEQRRGKSAASMLRAKTTELGDGKLKLVWEFADAKEAEDWSKIPGYLSRKRKSKAKTDEAPADAGFAVTKGYWGGAGSVFYRMCAAFTGPVVVRYTFHFDENQRANPVVYLACAICDDGRENLALGSFGGDINLDDSKSSEFRSKEADGEAGFTWDKDETSEFELNEKELVTRYAKEDRARMPAPRRKSGFVGFIVQSEMPMAFDKIEIEGKLDPASFPDLERAWTARQLVLLGFP